MQRRPQPQRQVGHGVKRVGALGRPAPDLPVAVGRLAEIVQSALEQLQIHRVYGAIAMRLAKFLAGAGVASRRAAEPIIRSGRVTVDGVRVLDPATDVTPEQAVAVDGRAGDRGAGAGRVRGQQARRRRVHRQRPAAPPHRRLAGPIAAAPVSGGTARHRHHRPDPAHQRRRARLPAHPPELRGAQDLPGRVANPPVADRTLRRPAPRRRARRRAHRARARAPPGRRHARAHHPRGPQAPGQAHVRARRPSRPRAGAGGVRPAGAGRPRPRRLPAARRSRGQGAHAPDRASGRYRTPPALRISSPGAAPAARRGPAGWCRAPSPPPPASAPPAAARSWPGS